MAPSSFYSSSNDFSYDVFISFRGTDTRHGFTGHLYKTLRDKGIRTFIDDKELQRGDEITPSLRKSIEHSRIAIIVFSENYASSSFCLDELVHIIHCFREKGTKVIPVFYDVEPSDVRHQTNRYGEALAEFEERFQNNKENMERLQKWKIALNQAANLSGYPFKKEEYEYEFITKIVTEISNKIKRVPLEVANHLVVEQESQLFKVKSLLDVDCDNEVHMIGIYGTGGLCKSTLARAVYNLIANQFEGLCFLHNVRENSNKYGLEYLQEQLLYKTLGEKFKFGHVSEGIPIIKQRLHTKKVLLILDDVDELKQLKVLVGEPGWLGPGSRVIITTRDKKLLSDHEIQKIHEAVGLNKEEALELLRNVAFKSNKIDSRMEDDKEVARGFDKIKDVDDSKDVWVLAVRIVDLWPVIGKYKSEHLEMIVKDAEGDVIHITLPKDFLAKFKPQLMLDQTYEMENFKVSSNDLVVKACDHRFRLTATGATVIEKQDFPDIAMASFNFKDFAEVLAGKYSPDLLVDVIGAFQEVTNTNRGNGRLRSITFTLKDASANILHCCLWDDHAKLCADAFSKFDGTQPQPYVILIKHARVKPEQAPYPLCFTNTWDGTQVMFNPPLLDVALFKEKFKDLPSDALSLSQTYSQYSQGSQFSQNTDIMSNATFLSLAEISNISQELSCVTVAEVKKLNATRHGWTYDGCNHCTRSVNLEGDKWVCYYKHKNDEPLPRYKIEVTAVHKEETIRLIFWDELSASILKISAADLRKKMVRAGLTNPRTYPKTLDKLLYKKKVYKIKALPGGNPCSVLQVSESEPLLANLEKQFGVVETSSGKQPLGLEMADIGTSSKQSVGLDSLELSSKDTSMVPVESLCGENDLNVTSSTTPRKRLSMDDTDFEVVPATQDAEPTQCSDTKVSKPPRNAKTPKIER